MSSVLQGQFNQKMGRESPTTRSPARSLSSSFQSSIVNVSRLFTPVAHGFADTYLMSADAPPGVVAISGAPVVSSPGSNHLPVTTTPERTRLRIDTNRPPTLGGGGNENPLSGGLILSPLSATTSIKDFIFADLRSPSTKSYTSDVLSSPTNEPPPPNADPETIDEWNMIQHEKQNYASLVHQVLGIETGSVSAFAVSSPASAHGNPTEISASHDEVSDLIRSTRDNHPKNTSVGEVGQGWLEEETIAVNEEVINELERMLQNSQFRNSLMYSQEVPFDADGEHNDDNERGLFDFTGGRSVNMNVLPVSKEGPTFTYHFSAPPVAFLSEEMERELAQRAERRKRRAVLLRQMAAAQARLKQRELLLNPRLNKDSH